MPGEVQEGLAKLPGEGALADCTGTLLNKFRALEQSETRSIDKPERSEVEVIFRGWGTGNSASCQGSPLPQDSIFPAQRAIPGSALSPWTKRY